MKFSETDLELWWGGDAIREMVSITGAHAGKIGISGISKPKHIPKKWGFELVYQNNPRYCMKLLTIRPGEGTSLHLHLEKAECLLVKEGSLTLKYINHGKEDTLTLVPGEAFVVAPGFPHQLINENLHEETILVEASTTSFDEDSIRIRRD